MKCLNKKIIWTIFRIERRPNGGYKAIGKIDKAWLKRQRDKLTGIKKDVVFIIADLFAEYVYKCRLPDQERKQFMKKLNSALIECENFAGVFAESEIVEKDMGMKEYILRFERAKQSIKTVSRIELDRRKSLYNPKNLKINRKELWDIAVKAKAAMKTEQVLSNLLINYNE